MFIGNIDNIDKDGGDFHAVIYSVLEYLRTTDFTNISDGSFPMPHMDFIVKVQRYTTRPIDELHAESHEKFIDVQFVASGEEILSWCPLSPELKILEPYDEKDDVTFYKNMLPESSLVLSARYYAVLFPLDVHKPCGVLYGEEPQQVTKVVVKIPVEMILEGEVWNLTE